MLANFRKWGMWLCLTIAFPAMAAPALVTAKSSKLHGSAGQFDIPIDVGQPPNGVLTIEPRESGGVHTLVATFDSAITSVGAVSLLDPGGASLGFVGPPNIAGNEVTLNLSGVPNNTRAVVNLNGVNGTTDTTFSVGFLVGDTDSNGVVDSIDVSSAKARSGQTTASTSTRQDINASGHVSAVDISVIKANLGMTLPMVGQASVSVSISGTGAGTITSMPALVSCPAVCAVNVNTNATVTLTAAPQAGSSFVGWSGDCSGSNSVTTLTVVRSSHCTAQFAINTYVVTPSAGANGSIAPSVPQVINHGQRSTFVATPGVGYIAVFGGTCGGSVAGNTYVTNPIVSACTVNVTFSLAASPIVLYTDITSGPNTGGENNKGIYLSIFGKNFGTGGLGSTVRVFINDVEVDNYRYFGASRGRPDIQQITVQVGALGNPVPGVALPIKVTVGGLTSNIDNFFTVNPGTIYFVSTTGNDITGVPGSIANPYRTVQKSTINNNSTPGCPITAGNQSVANAGVWGLVQPGDFIVMRGGTWTDVSKDNFFIRTQNKSGKLATGAAGTGPITIMGFPGETPFINRTNSVNRTPGGGISSADSDRQGLGCGSRITITNLKVESGFNDGPITTQAGALNPAGSYWRVVNNEMTAISCQANDNCKGAGVAGSGLGNYWVGNYVHDVYDKPGNNTDFENHGFYVDGVGSYEVAYNYITNIFGGNGVQLNSTTTPTTPNASIHHNIIRNVGKHGINLADGSAGGITVYNNLVNGADIAGIRVNSKVLAGARVFNNTFYDTDRLNLGGNRAAIMSDDVLPANAIEFRNNIVVPNGASRKYFGGSVGFVALSSSFSNNLYFNGTGSPIGSGNITGNPLFISTLAGNENFRLQPLSPGIGNGNASACTLVVDDIDAANSNGRTLRPIGSACDIGAYEQ